MGELFLPAQASDVADQMRTFLDSVHRPYTNNDVVEHVSFFKSRYEAVCGESPWRSSSNPNIFAVNGDALVRFSSSLAGFFTTDDATLLARERIMDPDTSSDIYGAYLGGGFNCPDGSPAQVRIAMEKESVALRRDYNVLGALALYWADEANYDLTRNHKEAGLIGLASIQAENIVEALGNQYFNGANGLEVLKILNGLVRNPTTRLLGVKLLNMIGWDEEARPLFRNRFNELVREAVGFGPKWRMALEFAIDTLRTRASVLSREIDWEEGVREEVIKAGPGKEPVLSSILALLDKGDDRLAERFLEVLDSWNWTGPYAIEDLLHIAAYQKVNDARRLLIGQAMALVDKENVDTSIVTPFVSKLIELMSYPAAHLPTERNLVMLIDRMFKRQDGEVDLTGVHGLEVIADFVNGLKKLYAKFFSERTNEAEAKELVDGSVAGMVLKLAASQRLNDVRIVLMRNALNMPEAASWDGRSSPWRYLKPLMDTDPREQKILDEAKDVWDYLRDYYMRHPENGGHGSGGTAMPPSATPAPQASSPPFTSMPFGIGGAIYVSGGARPLVTGSLVLSAGVFI